MLPREHHALQHLRHEKSIRQQYPTVFDTTTTLLSFCRFSPFFLYQNASRYQHSISYPFPRVLIPYKPCPNTSPPASVTPASLRVNKTSTSNEMLALETSQASVFAWGFYDDRLHHFPLDTGPGCHRVALRLHAQGRDHRNDKAEAVIVVHDSTHAARGPADHHREDAGE